MPYGIPWGMFAFLCASCGQVHCYDVYRPYCSLCGAKQPPENEIKAKGLVVSSSIADSRAYTDDIQEMNAFLRKHRGKRIAIWKYNVSHGELEIRLAHSGGPNRSDEPWLNTIIYCMATEAIQMPKLSWDCNLTIEVKQNTFKTIKGPISLNYYLLIDKSAKIQIKCRNVGMYFDVKPGL